MSDLDLYSGNSSGSLRLAKQASRAISKY